MSAMMASCTVNRATVISTSTPAPMRTTTTVTSLDVSSPRISYTYVPTKSDSKRLSESQLLDNAIFMALKENGNADVLVKVNYYVTKKRGLFNNLVKSISISGYPARYVDFRQPTEADYRNFELMPQSKSDVVVEKTSLLKRIFKRRNKR